eukprot:scaffold1286_cov124-Skeletonema_marinoi.AAC.2
MQQRRMHYQAKRNGLCRRHGAKIKAPQCNAAGRNAPIKSNEEECARGMGHIAILMTNQQHLLYHVDQQMIKQLQLFPIN